MSCCISPIQACKISQISWIRVEGEGERVGRTGQVEHIKPDKLDRMFFEWWSVEGGS